MDLLNAFVTLSNFVLDPGDCLWFSQLALGALGVTLIYGILRFSNFAHGDTMAFGAMATILFTWCVSGDGTVGFGPLPTALLALPFGIAACMFSLCWLTDRALSTGSTGCKRPNRSSSSSCQPWCHVHA